MNILSFSRERRSTMRVFIHDIAALISLTTFVAAIGVLAEVVRLAI
jgi:hypothetical protein